MPKQTVPDIEFDKFVIAQIPRLFAEEKILINTEYQRGDIWKQNQQIELIRSIINRYSIGVLVLFKNDEGQFEILDGQQRLLTIHKYLTDSPKLDLSNAEIPKYSELEFREKTLLDAYCVFYLKLKSHDPDSKEEDIVQTFLRLQEGTPLNKAEKINAYRGEFKNTFKKVRETHAVFQHMGNDKRFRLRQLAAELLLLELEGDIQNKIFPSLDLDSMIHAVKKFEKTLSKKRVTFFVGNLDFLHNSLNYLLSAFQPRELISFYLLVSYLRQEKAGNQDLVNELAEFAKQFMENLSRFSIYDTEPPQGMPKDLFDKYRIYKVEAKIMTTGESIKKRFEIILAEFERLNPFIRKDKERLHDIEQKRILYFRQKGLCGECNKPMDFKKTSSHHVIAHSDGGTTSELGQAQLLHEKCHQRIEKRKHKAS